MKDRTQKTADEMDFDEFVSWATGYIIFGIAEGGNLRHLVHMILIQALLNPNFNKDRS